VRIAKKKHSIKSIIALLLAMVLILGNTPMSLAFAYGDLADEENMPELDYDYGENDYPTVFDEGEDVDEEDLDLPEDGGVGISPLTTGRFILNLEHSNTVAPAWFFPLAPVDSSGFLWSNDDFPQNGYITMTNPQNIVLSHHDYELNISEIMGFHISRMHTLGSPRFDRFFGGDYINQGTGANPIINNETNYLATASEGFYRFTMLVAPALELLVERDSGWMFVNIQRTASFVNIQGGDVPRLNRDVSTANGQGQDGFGHEPGRTPYSESAVFANQIPVRYPTTLVVGRYVSNHGDLDHHIYDMDWRHSITDWRPFAYFLHDGITGDLLLDNNGNPIEDRENGLLIPNPNYGTGTIRNVRYGQVRLYVGGNPIHDLFEDAYGNVLSVSGDTIPNPRRTRWYILDAAGTVVAYGFGEATLDVSDGSITSEMGDYEFNPNAIYTVRMHVHENTAARFPDDSGIWSISYGRFTFGEPPEPPPPCREYFHPEFEITKNLLLPAGVVPPNRNFNFEISLVDLWFFGPIRPLPDFTTITRSIPFTNGMGTPSGTATFDFNHVDWFAMWPDPGFYTFQVREVASTPNPETDSIIVYDTNVFYVFLQVGWICDGEDDLGIMFYRTQWWVHCGNPACPPGANHDPIWPCDATNCTMDGLCAECTPCVECGWNKGGDILFQNTYIPLSPLEVRKQVTGNSGNRVEPFNMSIRLTLPQLVPADVRGPITGGIYRYGSNTRTPVSIPIDITLGSEPAPRQGFLEFQLRHGDRLVLDNMPIGTTYTVTEYFVSDHEQTAFVTEAGVTGSEINNRALIARPNLYAPGTMRQRWVAGDAEGTGTLNSDNNVLIVNHLDRAPPMGVLVDNAPFIGLILLAGVSGVIGFVRLRKREYEEDIV